MYCCSQGHECGRRNIHVLESQQNNTYFKVMYVHAASTEQIDKAKEVIKKLTFKYQPDAFENPGGPYN